MSGIIGEKINSKQKELILMDGKKRNEEKVIQQVITKEEFCKKVKNKLSTDSRFDQTISKD